MQKIHENLDQRFVSNQPEKRAATVRLMLEHIRGSLLSAIAELGTKMTTNSPEKVVQAVIEGTTQYEAKLCAEARLLGWDNDHESSVGVGVRIFLTSAGMDIALDNESRSSPKGHPRKRSAFQQSGQAWMISVPKGTFFVCSNGHEWVQFFNDVQDERRELPFSHSYEEVVRVEGNDGTFWQNPWYRPDGSRRPEEEFVTLANRFRPLKNRYLDHSSS